MKNRHWNATLIGIYGAGALTMYFLDPQRGRRRRAALKDTLVYSKHECQRFSGRFQRDIKHRIDGVFAEAEHLLGSKEVSDHTLEQRIRSAFGRTISHPHAVQVKCKDGSVQLSGWILADELKNLEKVVESVSGVTEVSMVLHIADHPEHIPAMQGGAERQYTRDNWSPTARVAAGGAGLGLIALGLLRRKTMGAATTLAGSALLARSILNLSLQHMAGIGRNPGLRIQKSMHVNASPAALYEFWANPENYPRIFMHVKQVTHEGDGAYRWHVTGPAGVPLSWTAVITRQVREKLVEWRSLRGSAIENHGIIHLTGEKEGPTQVHIEMTYTPPAGVLGHAFASLLGVDPKSMMDHDFVQIKTAFEHDTPQLIAVPRPA